MTGVTRVLGVDPGLIACGLAIVDVGMTERRCTFSKTIRQSSDLSATDRISVIGLEVADLLGHADLLVCEDQFHVFWAMQRAGKTNPNAARLDGLVQHLGCVAIALSRHFLTVTPGQIRKLMGCRRDASKEMVARAARIQCGGVPARASKDAKDAVSIALSGWRIWHREEMLKTRRKSA